MHYSGNKLDKSARMGTKCIYLLHDSPQPTGQPWECDNVYIFIRQTTTIVNILMFLFSPFKASSSQSWCTSRNWQLANNNKNNHPQLSCTCQLLFAVQHLGRGHVCVRSQRIVMRHCVLYWRDTRFVSFSMIFKDLIKFSMTFPGLKGI